MIVLGCSKLQLSVGNPAGKSRFTTFWEAIIVVVVVVVVVVVMLNILQNNYKRRSVRKIERIKKYSS